MESESKVQEDKLCKHAPIPKHTMSGSSTLEANLHWERARSSRARFFVLLRSGVAVPSRAEPCAELPDATKQTKDHAWQLLARPQCRLAFTNKLFYPLKM